MGGGGYCFFQPRHIRLKRIEYTLLNRPAKGYESLQKLEHTLAVCSSVVSNACALIPVWNLRANSTIQARTGVTIALGCIGTQLSRELWRAFTGEVHCSNGYAGARILARVWCALIKRWKFMWWGEANRCGGPTGVETSWLSRFASTRAKTSNWGWSSLNNCREERQTLDIFSE